jgi:hypothetical protein
LLGISGVGRTGEPQAPNADFPEAALFPVVRGFEDLLIGQGQAKRLEMRRALTGFFHVGDGLVPFPSQTGMQVTDSDSGRASDARSAVEIDGVAFGEQLI